MEFEANGNSGFGSDGVEPGTAFAQGSSASAAASGTGRRVMAQPGQQNVVLLPAGASFDDLSVRGDDLVITLPDGSQIVVIDGVLYDVDLVIEGVTVPDENWKDYLGVSADQIDPEAGNPASSGGNFAEAVAPIDPAYALGDLLPYTELSFTTPETREIFPGLTEEANRPPNGVPQVVSVPSVANNDAGTFVDEDGLPARDGDLGPEPAGTMSEADGESTTGTVTFVSPDGVDAILIDGVPVYEIVDGEVVITFPPTQIGNGTLTVVGVDLTNGTITYNYVLTDNTQGDDNTVSFEVTVVDPQGDRDSGTVVIRIIDDEPIAVNDGNLATIDDGAAGVVIGTVAQLLGNDDYGADGPGSPAITIELTGNRGGTITIVDGKLVYSSNTDVAPGDTVVEMFTYTILDGDGDVSNTATFTITLTEGGPSIGGTPDGAAATIVVDEDGLAGGIAGGEGDVPGAATGATGVIADLDFGPDGPGDIVLGASADTGLVSQAGNPVETVWDQASHTLTGQDAVTGEPVFTVSIDPATGSYVFTLLAPVTHASGLNENDASFSIPVIVTDSDGDAATGSIAVTINDDSPVMALTGAQLSPAVLDESPLSADGLASVTVNYAGAFAAGFGADGAGGIVYALNLAGSDVGSGLFTLEGAEVLLNLAGDVVTGSAGGTDYFTISVDAATGAVTFAFTGDYANIAHGNAASNDDPASLMAAAGMLTLSATVTDADGDAASAAIDLGDGVFVIEDDGPAAADDGLFQVGEDTALRGIDVLANDSPGTDGVDPATGIVVVTGPAKGTLVYNGDGTFDYTPNPGASGDDSFTYRITDADGDSATATVSLTIAPDSTPIIRGIANVTVDEDGLAGANADDGQTDPAEVTSTGLASATGAITVNFGADVPADPLAAFQFSDPDALDRSLSSGGQPVDFSLDAHGNIVGTIDGGATPVITIVLTGASAPAGGDVTYSYEVTLLQPVDHPATGNDENGVDLSGIGFTVTDSDGDPASGSFAVTITDDVPSVDAAAGTIPALIVDDSDFGADASANFAGVFAIVAGADAAASTVFALSVSAPGAASGLFAAVGGDPILLFMDGTDVVGRVGGAAGDIAFRVSVDADGTVTLDQSLAIRHGDPADPIEAAPDAAETLLAADLVTLTATVIDKDGDSASASIGIGQSLFFEDDGPAIAASAAVDTGLAQTGDAALPGSGSFDLTAAFGYAGANFGNDGPGTITESYSLSLLVAEGAASGINSGGAPVYLYVSDDGQTVTGSTSANEAGVTGTNTVFTISVSADGTVTLAQSLPIDHPVGSDLLMLADGLVQADYTVTITDGDGDSVSQNAAIDLGGNIAFADDAPSIAVTGAAAAALLDESPVAPDGDGIVSVTVDFSGNFVADNGADAPGTISYALALGTDGAGSGLFALDRGDISGSDGDPIGKGDEILLSTDAATGDIVGSANGTEYFRISVDADNGEVTFSQSANIWHPWMGPWQDMHDDAVSLSTAPGVLSLVATATDSDFDSAQASLDIGDGVFTIEDDGPSFTAFTKYSTFALLGDTEHPLVATGALGFDGGTDGLLGGALGTAVTFELLSTSSVGGVAITNIGQPVFDPVEGVWNFTFDYVAPNGQTGSNSGTIALDGSRYTMTLDEGFGVTEVISTSGVIGQTFWDSTGTGTPGHSEIVVSELATGNSDPLFIRFTGANGALNAGGDNAFSAGEQVSGTAAWVSATNTANGVAGDTIQNGEVLDFDLFFRDPENYQDWGYATFASGLTLTLDGVGNREDLVVILKLADPSDPSHVITTRAIVVGNDDIYGRGDTIPDGYGAPVLDNNDGFVIIEANDYLQAGEGLVIVGAQLMTSSNGLTGSGIDLNRAVGEAGGSTGSVAFGADTNDNDVMKITDIGVIRTVTDEQAVSLDFTVTVTDADGDTTFGTFHVNPFHDPVILDLDGDGIHFQPLGAGAAYDHDGDGIADQTAWIAAGDAILVRDANGNGIVDDVSEFVFHRDGMTDLQTLRADHGDVLDANDAAFGSYGLWIDDGDGVFEAGEFKTLAEAGITSIGLVSDGQTSVAAGGDVKIVGSASFTGPNGTGTLVDAAFRFVPGTRQEPQRQHEAATIAAAAPAMLVAASLDNPAISFNRAMVNLNKTPHIAELTDDPVPFASAPALAVAQGTGMSTAAIAHAAGPVTTRLHAADTAPDAHIAAQSFATSAEPVELGSSSQTAAGFAHGPVASGLVAASAAADAQMDALLALSAETGAASKGTPDPSAARDALAEVMGKDPVSTLVDRLLDARNDGEAADHGQEHGATVTQSQADHVMTGDISAILHGEIAGAAMAAHATMGHAANAGDEAALAAAH